MFRLSFRETLLFAFVSNKLAVLLYRRRHIQLLKQQATKILYSRDGTAVARARHRVTCALRDAQIICMHRPYLYLALACLIGSFFLLAIGYIIALLSFDWSMYKG